MSTSRRAGTVSLLLPLCALALQRPATSPVSRVVVSGAYGDSLASKKMAYAVELGPCENFADLQTLVEPVNERCCDEPEDDCSSGVPSTCDADCGAVLLPFRAACADFLKVPMNAGMKNLIDQAADGCRVRPGVSARPPPPPGPCEPNPCKNGGTCNDIVAPKSLGEGVNRGFTCSCKAGWRWPRC